MLAGVKWCSLPLICSALASAFAAELSVLNDHLRLNIPDAAVAEEIPNALMEASRHSTKDLIIVGSGNECLRVEVIEKGYLAEETFAQTVRQAMSRLNEEGDFFTIEQMGDHLVYAILREAPPNLSHEREYPYAYAEYRHPDGTVQKLTILIRGKAAGDVQARRMDITAWLQSLTPGKRKLNTEARTEQQTSYMADCHVSVPVPEGFYTELHEGEGFHYATYARLGKRDAPVEQFSVQVGDHPQLSFEELPASQLQTQSGTMAGQKAEWHLFEEAGLLFAECVLPLGPRGSKPTFSAWSWPCAKKQEIIYLHVTIITQEADARTQLICQAERITVSPAQENR